MPSLFLFLFCFFGLGRYGVWMTADKSLCSWFDGFWSLSICNIFDLPSFYVSVVLTLYYVFAGGAFCWSCSVRCSVKVSVISKILWPASYSLLNCMLEVIVVHIFEYLVYFRVLLMRCLAGGQLNYMFYTYGASKRCY